jgi:type I restriction enzyme M protein
VLASVDLPVEAFLPQVGVQASLLFLRRKSQAEMDAEAMGTRPDYTVFMAVAEKVGHDRRGVTLYQRDADGAEIIFQGIRTSLRRSKNRQLPKTIDTPIQDKRVDDNLPLIGKAYKNFLKTGQNKE